MILKRAKSAVSTAIVAVLMSSTTSATAAEVTKTALFNASPDQVWALIGEFSAIGDWHPAVQKVDMSGDAQSGMFRTLHLPDGATLKEKLLARSNAEMHYSYSIVSTGVLPVSNYVSTIRAWRARQPGQTVVQWSSTFGAVAVTEPEAEAVMSGIYAAGFDGIRGKLK